MRFSQAFEDDALAATPNPSLNRASGLALGRRVKRQKVDRYFLKGDRMGLRFDLNLANWVAFVISDRDDVPDFNPGWFEPGPQAQQLALETFLRHLREGLMSSARSESDFRQRVNLALEAVQRNQEVNARHLDLIRDYFRDRDWTALILPSGYGRSTEDKFLCSPDLLRTLVNAGFTEHGLLLQLEDPPTETFALTDVFPAFSLALHRRTEWPGLLAWDKRGDSAFFPLPAESGSALEQLTWITRHLQHGRIRELEERHARSLGRVTSRLTTIIQLSDIHLGSSEANLRLPRLQQHVDTLIREHSAQSDVLLAVTGDLMDSPDDQHLDRVRAFLQFLSQYDLPPPIILVGNHDVRQHGFLSKRLQAAFEMPSTTGPSGVRWFDEQQLGVVMVNSVVDGCLASGRVGERQLIDLANQLDVRRNRREEFSLIGAIHHHPIPVERPDWYARAFYEKILGASFERTDALEDANAFLLFAREHRFSAIIHGHKHIPRLGSEPSGIPVIGCGSSVGKVPTSDNLPYLSVNLLTLDRGRKRLAARLLASRVSGGRLTEQQAHQAVLASSL